MQSLQCRTNFKVLVVLKLFRLWIHFYTYDEMHVNPLKLAFKKNNLFQYFCLTAHVNLVLHPTITNSIFTKSQNRKIAKSQLNPLIQQSDK